MFITVTTLNKLLHAILLPKLVIYCMIKQTQIIKKRVVGLQ